MGGMLCDWLSTSVKAKDDRLWGACSSLAEGLGCVGGQTPALFLTQLTADLELVRTRGIRLFN